MKVQRLNHRVFFASGTGVHMNAEMFHDCLVGGEIVCSRV